MNREMTRKVIEEAVKIGDVEVVMQTIDHMESVAHKCLGELKEDCIQIMKTRLMESGEGFKSLLSELKLSIEKDTEEKKKKELESLLLDFDNSINEAWGWYEIEENGEWRKVTDGDRLNYVHMEWQALRKLLYMRFGIDAYREEWEREVYLND